MLRTLKSLQGYRLLATDGVLGKVDEFYFDDNEWVVRYLVAEVGTWLPGRLVLVSPQSLGKPDWTDDTLPVSLTKEQIKESPPIQADRPVSRQLEVDLHDHFKWLPYWSPVGMLRFNVPSPVAAVSDPSQSGDIEMKTQCDLHLRSSHEVIGYHIRATDHTIGHVEDFIVDCDDWTIRYMVVDTKNWLPGKKVLVSRCWISLVNWADCMISVDLTREQVKGSPEFDPHEPVNREYESRLYDYYGRPRHW